MRSRIRRRCCTRLASAGIAVEEAIYVGDDLRDIQAGRAAGIGTVAAAYGYLGDGAPIEAWGADHIIRRPEELLAIVLRQSS